MNGQQEQKLTLEEAHVMLSRQATQIAQLNYDNSLLTVRLEAAIEHIQSQQKEAEAPEEPKAPAKSGAKGK